MIESGKKTYPIQGDIAHKGKSSWRQREVMIKIKTIYFCIVSYVGWQGDGRYLGRKPHNVDNVEGPLH